MAILTRLKRLYRLRVMRARLDRAERRTVKL